MVGYRYIWSCHIRIWFIPDPKMINLKIVDPDPKHCLPFILVIILPSYRQKYLILYVTVYEEPKEGLK